MSSNEAFVLALSVLWSLVMFRNYLVHRIQGRRIKEIGAACRADLSRQDFYTVMDQRFAELNSPGYIAMVFDLRCWTFRQFYPKDVT